MTFEELLQTLEERNWSFSALGFERKTGLVGEVPGRIRLHLYTEKGLYCEGKGMTIKEAYENSLERKEYWENIRAKRKAMKENKQLEASKRSSVDDLMNEF